MTKLDRKVKSMAENDTFSAKQSQMSKKMLTLQPRLRFKKTRLIITYNKEIRIWQYQLQISQC